ncbi:MAG: hypothetical protein ACP5PX_06670 [Candidatus Hadarchaeum sp.]|uniref:hypothetical protein n=1 Tax=Candidatus Hadarchaeum sp. TaxID=2883567 RepID=UPI003D111140
MTVNGGEDLLSILVATVLLLMLAAAAINWYQNTSREMQEMDDLRSTLDTAEAIIYGAMDESRRIETIEILPGRLENLSKILFLRGVNMQVEIRSLTGKLIYKLENFSEPQTGNYFAESSVSLPIALACDSESVLLCELKVQLWRE